MAVEVEVEARGGGGGGLRHAGEIDRARGHNE